MCATLTEKEDHSDVDDVVHLGQRGTAALKEAEVNGCSCCCTVRTLGNIWKDKITKNFTPIQIHKYSLDDLVFFNQSSEDVISYNLIYTVYYN